jgi:RNA recognition motif-containing protein
MGRTIKVEEAKKKEDNRQFQKRPDQRQNNQNQGFKNDGEVNIETPTLFIGGLSYNSTSDSIKAFFSSIGEVQSARVVTDK